MLMNLIVQLITGGVGGNVAGMLMKKNSLGLIGNTLAGVVGGGVGGQLLGMIPGIAQPDAGLSLGAAAGSLVGGGGLMAIIGAVRRNT